MSQGCNDRPPLDQGCTGRPPYNTKQKIASVRVGSQSVACASGGGRRPSPCLLFSNINKSQGDHKNGGFAWEGSKKCLVPGLVPLGSALVQVTKKVFFTRNQLGSWLGSTWFLLGSSLRDPQKQRFRLGGVEKTAWLLAWFRLVPTWFQFVSSTKTEVSLRKIENVQTSQQLGRESTQPKIHKECTSGAQGLQVLSVAYCSILQHEL